MPINEQERTFNQKVVIIGGGTGQFNLLRGMVALNKPDLITAMPGTWDNGGSTGRLRTELGVLPMGDARACLVGLMEDEEQQKETLLLSDDRFDDIAGPLHGHDFLNLELQRLTYIHGGFEAAIDAFRKRYLIRGRVIPSSLTSLHLIAKTKKGTELFGESELDHRFEKPDFDPTDRIIRIYLNTPAEANPRAIQALSEADKIVISSGSLYGSIVPHFLIRRISEAIRESKARVVYVQNLMSERGQTDLYTVSDHLEAVVRYLGKGRINDMLVNDNHIDPDILRIYEDEGQMPVILDEEKCLQLSPGIVIRKTPLASYLVEEHLLRHDPMKLARAVLELD